jgi:putative lipoic acid-binding regulatory protein
MTDKPTESLLTFPCDFPIKIFGLASEEFEATVFGILHKHTPNIDDRLIESRPSANGKYKAITVTIHIESKEQLDRIYQDLSSSPLVLMAL